MAVLKPSFRVEIKGIDYTDRFAPRVLTIQVTDKDGVSSDTCRIALADIDGEIAFPQKADPISIYMGEGSAGPGLIFAGFVEDVNSSGSKGGGAELRIGGNGVDSRSKAKEQKQKHKDNTTLGAAAKEWGRDAGLSDVVMSESIAALDYDYLAMQNESYLQWAQRMAREVGATFKIYGGRGIFVETNGGKTASGQDLPVITAAWGVNLERWDVSPVVGRDRHKKTRSRYYDDKAAKWQEVEVDTANTESDTTHTDMHAKARQKDSSRKAKSQKGRSERNAGDGQVTILGNADAKPEALCEIVGVRPGIDGTYRIASVNHHMTKKEGWKTTLHLKQPQGTAGKDSRTKAA